MRRRKALLVRVQSLEHMSNSDRVQAWRNRAKTKLVEIAGGKCALCEYHRCQKALEFHHIDPSEKSFAVTGSASLKKFIEMVNEVRKCILVCANCHREVHAGLVTQEELKSKQVFLEDVAQLYITETNEAKVRFCK